MISCARSREELKEALCSTLVIVESGARNVGFQFCSLT
jgi:hypothetical protein